MNIYTKDIVDKGQNIIKVLETLQKRIDKRARTSLLNFFIADDTPGDFSLLDVLFLMIGTPRTVTDIKTLKIDEQIKKETNQWLEMILTMAPDVNQDLKLSYIRTFLQEESLLDDSISNKSDKRKSELIQNVITELKWNITIIQKNFSTPL